MKKLIILLVLVSNLAQAQTVDCYTGPGHLDYGESPDQFGEYPEGSFSWFGQLTACHNLSNGSVSITGTGFFEGHRDESVTLFAGFSNAFRESGETTKWEFASISQPLILVTQGSREVTMVQQKANETGSFITFDSSNQESIYLEAWVEINGLVNDLSISPMTLVSSSSVPIQLDTIDDAEVKALELKLNAEIVKNKQLEFSLKNFKADRDRWYGLAVRFYRLWWPLRGK